MVRRNSASLQAQVGGSNCCHAQPCLHTSACLRAGFCHFPASLTARHFAKILASRPSSPSTDGTKGVKCWRFSRRGLRCFLFFSLSCDSGTLSRFRLQQLFESVSVTRTSSMQSAPAFQNPRISKSPRSSSPAVASLSMLWLAVVAGKVFPFSFARPWMRGSSRTAEGVKALLAKLTNSSLISL